MGRFTYQRKTQPGAKAPKVHQEGLFSEQNKLYVGWSWICSPGEAEKLYWDPAAAEGQALTLHSPAEGTVQPFWCSEAEGFL